MLMLSVERLGVSYGNVRAVHDIGLHIAQGEVVTLIGANGAGKTSTLNALMGLLPSDGEIRYLGQDLRRLRTEARVQQGMSLVPERRQLWATMTVADNLTLGGFVRRGRPASEIAATRDWVLQLFPRLAERGAQEAGTLSGGEQQMLALGRALMARPRLLLLDEPSLGLAPLIVREIFVALASLRNEGMSLLLVEQNARLALKTADRAYVMERGSIVLEGRAAELAADERVAALYLGHADGAAR